MTDIEYDEWMSDSDALLWHIERDPLLRSTVTSVWLLDKTPEREQMDAAVNRIRVLSKQYGTTSKSARLRPMRDDAQSAM